MVKTVETNCRLGSSLKYKKVIYSENSSLREFKGGLFM